MPAASREGVLWHAAGIWRRLSRTSRPTTVRAIPTPPRRDVTNRGVDRPAATARVIRPV